MKSHIWVIAGALILAQLSVSMPAAALPSTEFGSQAVGTPVSSAVAISLTSAQLQAGVIFSFHYGTDFSAGCEECLGGNSGQDDGAWNRPRADAPVQSGN
jgi:hypothetical protein